MWQIMNPLTLHWHWGPVLHSWQVSRKKHAERDLKMEILRLLVWFKVGYPCVLVWSSYHISYVMCHMSYLIYTLYHIHTKIYAMHIYIYICMHVCIHIYIYISYQLHAVHISWCNTCFVNKLCTETFSFKLRSFVMQMVSASSPTVAFNGCKSRGNRIRSSSLENLATLSMPFWLLRALNVDRNIDQTILTWKVDRFFESQKSQPCQWSRDWTPTQIKAPPHGLFFGFKWSESMNQCSDTTLVCCGALPD